MDDEYFLKTFKESDLEFPFGRSFSGVRTDLNLWDIEGVGIKNTCRELGFDIKVVLDPL